MVAKRRKRPGRTRKDRSAEAAMAAGAALAHNVVRLRNTALRKRAAAIERAEPRMMAAKGPVVRVAPKVAKALGAPSPLGVLLAEGDSWFDYPFHDVLKKLEEDYGYDIESVAHMGDRVEDMAYDEGQFEKFIRTLDKLLRQGQFLKAILLSGGGNDVAGDEFAMLLEHANSPSPGLNESVLRGIIDERIRNAYISLISAMTTLSEARTGRTLPILIHGYARPVPDGRGVGGVFGGPLPGPWLEPGFRQKGFMDLDATTAMAGDLIDRFNAMLKSVAALPAFDHVHYIDLRDTLSNARPGYKTWWANELHPTGRGFDAVAGKFAAAIATV